MVKITTPKSLLSKLEYDFKQENREKSTVIYSQGISVGPDGYPDILKAYQEMTSAIPQKCRTKNIVFACSLNPNPREHLSDEQLMLIGKEFMERMGYKDQPFIITRHHDIEREHIHIVSTRVRPDGSKIPDRFEGRKARRIIDDLEVKYSLILSTKNQQKQKTKEFLKRSYGMHAEPVHIGTENQFEQIQAILRRMIPESKFQSIGEFNALLKKYNLKAEITKTEYRGKLYDGIVYVPIDSNGNKAGNPISGSELGRGFGISAVQARMKKSKEAVNERLPHFRQMVRMVMSTRPKTIEEMRSRLSKAGIRVEVFQNDKGRIYGITFVQDSTSTAINGSRLGKEFSANVFNDYFAPVIKKPDDFSQYTERQESRQYLPKPQEGIPQEQAQQAGEDDLSIDLSGGLLPSRSDDGRDFQEEAFQKRMRRLYGQNKSRRKIRR